MAVCYLSGHLACVGITKCGTSNCNGQPMSWSIYTLLIATFLSALTLVCLTADGHIHMVCSVLYRM